MTCPSGGTGGTHVASVITAIRPTALLLLTASLLTLADGIDDTGIHTPTYLELDNVPDAERKHTLVVCNAFPDSKSSAVGLREASHNSREPAQAWLRLRKPRHKIKERVVPADNTDAIWTRSISYGSCEEYHLDLSNRQLFFVSPDGETECKLLKNEMPVAKLTENSRLVVVFSQIQAGSSKCMIQALSAPYVPHREEGTMPMAELVAVDAFSQASAKSRVHDEEEVELEKEDQRRGLPPLPPLVEEGIIRLEDIVEDAKIFSEVIGSRSLDMGNVYSVDAKKMHMVLEDMRGTKMMDHLDVDFKAGQTYIAIRMGRGDDIFYPQHLVVHRCQDAAEQKEEIS